MLRIAILEKEQTAKDIIFECAKILGEWEWTFVHFTKISEFARVDERQKFDCLIMNELFHTQRISASFIETQPARIVIYCMDTLEPAMQLQSNGRIIYIDRKQIKLEMQRIKAHFLSMLQSRKEYLLSYANLLVPLQIQDIYYIEKSEKKLIYHTRKGILQERKTMAQAEIIFMNYDFIRIHASFLVNVAHVAKITKDAMVLSNQEELPIARARKKAVIDWFHAYVESK